MAARPSLRQGTKRGPGAGWRVPMTTRRQRIHQGAQTGTWVRRGRKADAGAELKFHDIDWDEAAADFSAGVISNTSSLVLIGQGVTESTRIGRKAVIKSIGWRGQLNLIAFAGTTIQAPTTVRLLLVQDKQCNGAAPDVSGTNGLLQSANFQSFNDLTNKGRFKVLSDQTIAMNAQAGAGDGTTNDSGAVHENFTVFKKCNIPIEYSGTASPSVIGELRTNNIFGILIASSSGSNVTLDSKFRFRFQDG